ncbi:MAG: alpha/beta hydrolase [Sinobacteraceae bacterium]|nr:alpha/beta hydrolase [Nevskiaceae bacterium]
MTTRRETLFGLGLAAAFPTALVPGHAATQSSNPSVGAVPYRQRSLKTRDRINIAVQDWGDPSKPAILFIHGFMSSSICWMRQLTSSLARDYRLVAYDWRGHGASDKPNDPLVYAHGERWAQEIDTVIAGLDLGKPILAGWSMAGEIIGDYLQYRGDKSISGINFVDAGALGFPTAGDEAAKRGGAAAALVSMDTLSSVRATDGFIRLCTATPMAPDDFAAWVAVGNMAPWYVRKYMTTRPQNDLRPLLRNLQVPVMITHGGRDMVANIEGSRRAAELIPDVRLKIHTEAGHASFWDAATAFNADLAEFAAYAHGKVA